MFPNSRRQTAPLSEPFSLNFLIQKNIKQRTCSVYNPNSNGISERFNSVLGSVMQTSKGEDINDVIRKAEYAISMSVNITTGFVPTDIIFKKASFSPIQKTLDIDLQQIKTRINNLYLENQMIETKVGTRMIIKSKMKSSLRTLIELNLTSIGKVNF